VTAAIAVLAAATGFTLLLFAFWAIRCVVEARTCWPGCQCRDWAATTILDMRRAEQAELIARSDGLDAQRRARQTRAAVQAFLRRTGGRRG